MNKLLAITCLGLLVFGCSSIHKYNSNGNIEQIGQARQVHNFAEIPAELLSHLEKMGVDSSLILNEYILLPILCTEIPAS